MSKAKNNSSKDGYKDTYIGIARVSSHFNQEPAELHAVFASKRGDPEYYAVTTEGLSEAIRGITTGTADSFFGDLSLKEAFRGAKGAEQTLKNMQKGKITVDDIPTWDTWSAPTALYRPRIPAPRK